MPLTVSEAIREDDISTGTTKNIKTGTDAGGRHIQFMAVADDDGNQVGFTGAPLVVSSAEPTVTYYDTGGAAEEQAVVSGSGTGVRVVTCLLDPAVTTSRYCMLFDATAAQANGATPIHRFLVPSQGAASVTFEYGRPVSSGLVVALSTTANTLTLPGSGEAYFSAQTA